MIVRCTICSDLMNPAENIYVTKCGHMFHYDCLHTWVVRAKTCPQCRHSVTQSSMFRVFLTSGDIAPSGEETAANLQMKLDHAMLKLNQQTIELKNSNEKITEINKALETSNKAIKNLEEKVMSKNSALAAQKEQMLYLQAENKQLMKVKEELETQKKNVQLLQGLQKVLNATVQEVEQMLEGYPDLHTVATFATALKKALYESETKKSELRTRLQAATQKLTEEKKKCAEWQAKFVQLEENINYIINSKKQEDNNRTQDLEDHDMTADISFIDDSRHYQRGGLSEIQNSNETNTSLNTLVNKIENSDSPYLNLKQSSLPGQLFNFREQLHKNKSIGKDKDKSIFHNKESRTAPTKHIESENNISYDGLGGHGSLDVFPKPKLENPLKLRITAPKLTSKHRLKRPNPSGTQQSIDRMLKIKKTENK